jgi:hypothetical protein
MKFVSRLIPPAGGSARGAFLMAMGVLALGFVAACQDNHIGRPCLTNAPADAGASGGAITVVSSPALQCPSRICLLPAAQGSVDVSNEPAFCSAPCSTDDDCSDTDPGTKCQKGFVCTWATTSGPFCCEKLCVCHDFVNEPMGGFLEPDTCTHPGSCQNVM